jgi:hypothetical protein
MKLLALPLLAVLAFPSCTTVQTARDQLEEMSQVEYAELNLQVQGVAFMAGKKLSEVLQDKPEVLGDIRELSTQLLNAVMTDTLNVNDLINYLVDRFGEDIDLKPEYQEYIRDGAKIIDAAVGQLRLGIDGTLSEREKGLVVSLLGGLAMGTLE